MTNHFGKNADCRCGENLMPPNEARPRLYSYDDVRVMRKDDYDIIISLQKQVQDLKEQLKDMKPGEYCLMCGKTKKEIKDKQLEC